MTEIRNRKRNRMIDFDYCSDNLYFVTSCTNDKVCCFGEIDDGGMILNELGEIAEGQWQWLINKYPYLISHAFVVMPNHIHGVLEINREMICNDTMGRTGRDLSLQSQQKIKSLSELMGAYKTTTSKKIHLLGHDDFIWQRSFHDHIIRNTKYYDKITQYIATNPENWADDKFYDKSTANQ